MCMHISVYICIYILLAAQDHCQHGPYTFHRSHIRSISNANTFMMPSWSFYIFTMALRDNFPTLRRLTVGGMGPHPCKWYSLSLLCLDTPTRVHRPLRAPSCSHAPGTSTAQLCFVGVLSGGRPVSMAWRHGDRRLGRRPLGNRFGRDVVRLGHRIGLRETSTGKPWFSLGGEDKG